MKTIAPNLYRYSTLNGVRYATRVTIGKKQFWSKGFVKPSDARDHLLEIQVGRVDAKYFPDRVPAPDVADYAMIWLKDCAVRPLRRSTLQSYQQNLTDGFYPVSADT